MLNSLEVVRNKREIPSAPQTTAQHLGRFWHQCNGRRTSSHQDPAAAFAATPSPPTPSALETTDLLSVHCYTLPLFWKCCVMGPPERDPGDWLFHWVILWRFTGAVGCSHGSFSFVAKGSVAWIHQFIRWRTGGLFLIFTNSQQS